MSRRVNLKPTKRRRSDQGQALLDTALIIPLLITLGLGTWDASGLTSAKNQATVASRDGARLTAALGNQGTNPMTGPFDPTTLDNQVIKTVNTTMSGTSFTRISRVDIYRPTSSDGTEQSTDLIDAYSLDAAGNPTPMAPPQYTLQYRIQTPPVESLAGVKVYFDYTAPAPIVPLFTGPQTAYTVMRLAPFE